MSKSSKETLVIGVKDFFPNHLLNLLFWSDYKENTSCWEWKWRHRKLLRDTPVQFSKPPSPPPALKSEILAEGDKDFHFHKVQSLTVTSQKSKGVCNQRWHARSASKRDCVTCHHSIEWREKKVCKGHFERGPRVGRKWKWFVKTQSWGRFYFEMAPAASSPQAQPSGGRPLDLTMEKRKPSKFGNLVSLLNCFLLFDDKSEISFGGQTKLFISPCAQ